MLRALALMALCFAGASLASVRDEGPRKIGKRLNRVHRLGTSRRGHSLDANTVALWRFDEVSGNAVDVTGNYPMNANGSPGNAAGQIGNSRTFSGNLTQYFERPSGDSAAVTAMQGPVTVEAWLFRPSSYTAGSGNHYFFDFGAFDSPAALQTNHLLLLGLSTTGQVFWYWETTALASISNTTTATVAAGAWSHVAVSKDGSNTVRVYINGSLVHTFPNGAGPGGGTQSYFAIGRHAGYSAAEYFEGRIDDMRLSNVVRTDTEILADYNAGR